MLLTAPKYFKMDELSKGDVLVEKGFLKNESISEKYGNRQFFFQDEADNKLKCLNGGQLAYIIDTHNLDSSKLVKITYQGKEVMENGKFAGKEAHQYDVELVEDRGVVAPVEEVVEENVDSLV